MSGFEPQYLRTFAEAALAASGEYPPLTRAAGVRLAEAAWAFAACLAGAPISEPVVAPPAASTQPQPATNGTSHEEAVQPATIFPVAEPRPDPASEKGGPVRRPERAWLLRTLGQEATDVLLGSPGSSQHLPTAVAVSNAFRSSLGGAGFSKVQAASGISKGSLPTVAQLLRFCELAADAGSGL